MVNCSMERVACPGSGGDQRVVVVPPLSIASLDCWSLGALHPLHVALIVAYPLVEAQLGPIVAVRASSKCC